MLSRLAQLCLRPAEGQMLQVLASITVATQQHAQTIVQVATLHQQQQQFSSSSKHLQAQEQSTSKAAAAARKEPYKPEQAVLSRIQAAQPTQPTMQILKTVLTAQDPMTSHELYKRVQQEYGTGLFPSRGSFKKYLVSLKRYKWVAAVPPAVRAKGAKGDSHFVFVATQAGYAVDLNAPAHGVRAVARLQADDWTKRHLPQYAEHMRAGRVPVTQQNLGVLEPGERLRLFRGALRDGPPAQQEQQQQR